MKFKETSFQMAEGIGRGGRRPASLLVSYFFLLTNKTLGDKAMNIFKDAGPIKVLLQAVEILSDTYVSCNSKLVKCIANDNHILPFRKRSSR